MDKMLDAIGNVIEKVTDPERIEKILVLAIRAMEAYARIKGLK